MKVTIVDGDGWVGIYVDGKLVTEDHSLRPQHVLSAVGIKAVCVEADFDWHDDRGCLPENLGDVKIAL